MRLNEHKRKHAVDMELLHGSGSDSKHDTTLPLTPDNNPQFRAMQNGHHSLEASDELRSRPYKNKNNSQPKSAPKLTKMTISSPSERTAAPTMAP